MPEPKDNIQAIRHLNRLVSLYNGIHFRGYFNPDKPLLGQRWFGQFVRLNDLLQREGVKPEEFFRVCPYPKGRFFPNFFVTEKVEQAIQDYKTFRKRVRSMETEGKEKDKQFLKEMIESTGMNLLYLVNFFWNDLQPETQAAFERFHNDYFLSVDDEIH
jgi:hypothetical protein